MSSLLAQTHFRGAAFLLLLGTAGLLMTSLFAGRGSAASGTGPGRRAMAHWLPIAAATLIFAMFGPQEMAIGLLFGTCVAALSSVVGFIGMTATMAVVPGNLRPLWFIAPVTVLLVLVCGMRGSLGWFEASVLITEGAAVLYLWREPIRAWSAGSEKLDATLYSTLDYAASTTRTGGPMSVTVRALVWTLLIALSGLCAIVAALGATRFSQADPHFPPRVIAGTVISIALTFPMIATASPLVARGEVAAALTGQIGLVMLNLCALLPLTILAVGLRACGAPWPHFTRGASTVDTLAEWTHHLHWPVLRDSFLPLVVWRIDVIGVLVLSVLLIPLSLGLISLDRRLSSVLIFAYSVYLMTALLSGLIG